MNNKELTVSIRKFLDKYLIEFSLVILSIFMFKTALGRSDWEHIPPSISLTYILLTYIIVKNFLHRALCKYNLGKVSVSLISFMLIFISAAGIYRIHNASAFAENFPLRVKDSEFIPDNYKATISFLKNNLSEEEEFFTMTSEASWYYFVDKACPARFPIVWLAGPPFYQKEIVDGLKRQNVKFILYKDGSSKNAIDGFDNEVRLPIVFDYIKQNYVFFKKIGDEEIWIRKQRK